MKDQTQTEAAIRYARGQFDALIERFNAGDSTGFSAQLETILKAVGSIAQTHSYECEMSSVSGSTATLAQKTIAQADNATDRAIAFETQRRLRRMGLDPKFATIRSAEDLLEMQAKEKAGS